MSPPSHRVHLDIEWWFGGCEFQEIEYSDDFLVELKLVIKIERLTTEFLMCLVSMLNL